MLLSQPASFVVDFVVAYYYYSKQSSHYFPSDYIQDGSYFLLFLIILLSNHRRRLYQSLTRQFPLQWCVRNHINIEPCQFVGPAFQIPWSLVISHKLLETNAGIRSYKNVKV